MSYKVDLTDFNSDQAYQADYVATANPAQNMNFDRLYNNRSSILLHHMTFKLPNFGAAFFGDYKFAGIVIGLQNELDITTNKIQSDVKDRDTTVNKYLNNSYLTNKRWETTYNVKPTLTFNKNINRSLSNRYEKTFSAAMNIGLQLYTLNSTSEKAFQQFSNSYQKFAPKASISYSNRQFGEFTNNNTLEIRTSSQYPTLQQLAPLVDSANLNYIQKGNAFLREQDTRELSYTFSHLSERSTNILTWSATLSAGYINNYFTNSSSIDGLGRNIYSIVNANGYRYINWSAAIKKAFKLKDSQVQFNLTPVISITRSPNYVNGILNYFNNFSLSYNPGIYYTYETWLAVNVDEKQTYNHYSQNGYSAFDLSNLLSQSEVSFSINCINKLTVGSNATYTKNFYDGAQVNSFTIWNATANYKLFKGNIAEIKLSALDLLHQNTGLINYGFNNSITQGSVNVLKQYFMLSFAYFPRKFGK